MNQRFLVSGLLGCLLIATAGVIGWQTDWGRALSHTDTVVEARKGTLDTNVLPRYSLPPQDVGYKEIVERPLFVPTRRPAPPSTSTAQVAMKKGQFKLAGTTVSAGVSVAYLIETSTNKTHRVNLGNEINGIKVERVDAVRVLLKQGEETEELSLRSSASPKLPPPTAVAAVNPGQPVPPNALPGPAGGNFGPPLPNQAQPALMPGQPNPQAVGVASAFPPPLPSNSVGATNPIQNVPQNPQDANAQNTPPDPNSAQIRRRRFQNLPQ